MVLMMVVLMMMMHGARHGGRAHRQSRFDVAITLPNDRKDRRAWGRWGAGAGRAENFYMETVLARERDPWSN